MIYRTSPAAATVFVGSVINFVKSGSVAECNASFEFVYRRGHAALEASAVTCRCSVWRTERQLRNPRSHIREFLILDMNMPLVIAIESDRQQATRLADVVRQRVGAELVLAGSLDEALTALRTRVPDVMLIPALLTPREGAALTEALHHAAGEFPVAVLITPTLAVTGRSFASSSGWPWKRKEQSEEEGCDPAVFADQLSTYLSQAADRISADTHTAHTALVSVEAVAASAQPNFEPAPTTDREDASAPPFEFALPERQFGSIDDQHARVPDGSPIESPMVDDGAAPVVTEPAQRSATIDRRPASIDGAASIDRPTRDMPFDQILAAARPSTDPTVAPSAEDRDWERLIASLRESVQALAVEAWLTGSPLQDETVRDARDEWGIHDPDQCAMPAVMRRLEQLDESLRARQPNHSSQQLGSVPVTP